MKNCLFFATALTLSLTACSDRNEIWQQNHDLPENTWNESNVLTYNFEATDTSAVYNLYMDIGFEEAYPSQNLYFKIKTVYPNGKTYEQVVGADLFDKTGKPNGPKTWFSSNHNYTLVMRERLHFNPKGNYKFLLTPFLREPQVPNITNIKFWMEKNAEASGKEL